MNEKRQNSIIKFIIENEEILKNSLNICKMIKEGYSPAVIELAIKLGADIHEYNDEVLMTLVENFQNPIEILKILKNSGMKFNTPKAADAAYTAIRNGNLLFAEYLIDNGVDVHWSEDIIIKILQRKSKENVVYNRILRRIMNSETY